MLECSAFYCVGFCLLRGFCFTSLGATVSKLCVSKSSFIRLLSIKKSRTLVMYSIFHCEGPGWLFIHSSQAVNSLVVNNSSPLRWQSRPLCPSTNAQKQLIAVCSRGPRRRGGILIHADLAAVHILILWNVSGGPLNRILLRCGLLTA